MTSLKFLDLFAGVGGFRSGMELAGHECVGYVEWDKFARTSYQSIYNTNKEYTAHDITTVESKELPKADVWTLGFPCQDISVAGKQKGIENGKQSSLFFTVTGLIKQLKEEDKPSYLFIENVKNLLSINDGWDFLKLQVELDEIGYDVEWDVLNSKEVIPQNRERVFIIGHLRRRSTREVFPITREGGTADSEQPKMNIVGTTHTKNDLSFGTRERTFADGLMSTLTATDYKTPKQIAVNNQNEIIKAGELNGSFRQNNRVYSADGIAPCLNTMTGGGREPKIAIKETGINQGVVIPTITPDRLNKRQNGRRFKEDGEPMLTLNTQDRHGVYDGLRIRKLTPLECWRLQGFTDWQFYAAKYQSKEIATLLIENGLNHYDCEFEQKTSNSQLYKQAGNSVTVPVIYEIASKLTLL